MREGKVQQLKRTTTIQSIPKSFRFQIVFLRLAKGKSKNSRLRRPARKLVTCPTYFSKVLRYLFVEEADKAATTMPNLSVFEVFLNKRGRAWTWRVCTTSGDIVMRGSESSRPAASYKAYRALFLLLQSAAYQSISLPVASRAEAAPITRIKLPGKRC
jgi:hypothetical protein